jgi:hypothetical protein
MGLCCLAPSQVLSEEDEDTPSALSQQRGVGEKQQSVRQTPTKQGSGEEESAIEERRRSSQDTGTSLPSIGIGRKAKRGSSQGGTRSLHKSKVVPLPARDLDSDVLLSDQAIAAASAAVANNHGSGKNWMSEGPNPPPPQRCLGHAATHPPTHSSMLSRSGSEGQQHRDMTAAELQALGFTLHSLKTTGEKSKLKTQPVAVLALEVRVVCWTHTHFTHRHATHAHARTHTHTCVCARAAWFLAHCRLSLLCQQRPFTSGTYLCLQSLPIAASLCVCVCVCV